MAVKLFKASKHTASANDLFEKELPGKYGIIKMSEDEDDELSFFAIPTDSMSDKKLEKMVQNAVSSSTWYMSNTTATGKSGKEYIVFYNEEYELDDALKEL